MASSLGGDELPGEANDRKGFPADLDRPRCTVRGVAHRLIEAPPHAIPLQHPQDNLADTPLAKHRLGAAADLTTDAAPPVRGCEVDPPDLAGCRGVEVIIAAWADGQVPDDNSVGLSTMKVLASLPSRKSRNCSVRRSRSRDAKKLSGTIPR